MLQCLSLFNPFTPKSDRFSNFSHSLTRNTTSHSLKNVAFHSLHRWKMIFVLPNSHCVTYKFLYKRLGECIFFNLGVNRKTFWPWQGMGHHFKIIMSHEKLRCLGNVSLATVGLKRHWNSWIWQTRVNWFCPHLFAVHVPLSFQPDGRQTRALDYDQGAMHSCFQPKDCCGMEARWKRDGSEMEAGCQIQDFVTGGLKFGALKMQ